MTQLHPTAILAAILGVASAPGQTASVTLFGPSCVGTISSTPPRLGQTFTITYQGPNSYSNPHGMNYYIDQPILVLGLSDRFVGGQPLPLQFPWYPYCSALVSNDVTLWMPFTSIPPSRFVDTYSANVPATTVLLGWSIFAQWLTRHVAPFFPTTWGTTNAARLTIGH